MFGGGTPWAYLRYLFRVVSVTYDYYIPNDNSAKTWDVTEFTLYDDNYKKYMPWRDYDGNAFLEGGGFWMQKQHIFLYPFYYIEYALSQICAFQYYGRMKEDRKAAWEDYLRLCRAGGTKGYFELLETGNLLNPFRDGTVKKSTAHVIEEIRRRYMQD